MPRFLASTFENEPLAEAGTSDVEMAEEPVAGDGATSEALAPEDAPVETAMPDGPSVDEPESDERAAAPLGEEPTSDVADSESEPAGEVGVETLPDISGVGVDTELAAHSLTLNGLTEASFSNSFRTSRMRTRPSTECTNCTGDDCVTVTGTLISTFRVTTTVTLPSVDDFPDLTACQRRRVRDGINNVLAPHEQQHVRAFRSYRGTVRTPISMTLCKDDIDSSVQALHDSIEAPRRSAAQAASDALDPFSFDVDLNCP